MLGSPCPLLRRTGGESSVEKAQTGPAWLALSLNKIEGKSISKRSCGRSRLNMSWVSTEWPVTVNSTLCCYFLNCVSFGHNTLILKLKGHNVLCKNPFSYYVFPTSTNDSSIAGRWPSICLLKNYRTLAACLRPSCRNTSHFTVTLNTDTSTHSARV